MLCAVVTLFGIFHSAVVGSVAALRQQNCELDADIATVLLRSVVDRIHDQVERLEALMREVRK